MGKSKNSADGPTSLVPTDRTLGLDGNARWWMALFQSHPRAGCSAPGRIGQGSLDQDSGETVMFRFLESPYLMNPTWSWWMAPYSVSVTTPSHDIAIGPRECREGTGVVFCRNKASGYKNHSDCQQSHHLLQLKTP